MVNQHPSSNQYLNSTPILKPDHLSNHATAALEHLHRQQFHQFIETNGHGYDVAVSVSAAQTEKVPGWLHGLIMQMIAIYYSNDDTDQDNVISEDNSSHSFQLATAVQHDLATHHRILVPQDVITTLCREHLQFSAELQQLWRQARVQIQPDHLLPSRWCLHPDHIAINPSKPQDIELEALRRRALHKNDVTSSNDHSSSTTSAQSRHDRRKALREQLSQLSPYHVRVTQEQQKQQTVDQFFSREQQQEPEPEPDPVEAYQRWHQQQDKDDFFTCDDTPPLQFSQDNHHTSHRSNLDRPFDEVLMDIGLNSERNLRCEEWWMSDPETSQEDIHLPLSPVPMTVDVSSRRQVRFHVRCDFQDAWDGMEVDDDESENDIGDDEEEEEHEVEQVNLPAEQAVETPPSILKEPTASRRRGRPRSRRVSDVQPETPARTPKSPVNRTTTPAPDTKLRLRRSSRIRRPSVRFKDADVSMTTPPSAPLKAAVVAGNSTTKQPSRRQAQQLPTPESLPQSPHRQIQRRTSPRYRVTTNDAAFSPVSPSTPTPTPTSATTPHSNVSTSTSAYRRSSIRRLHYGPNNITLPIATALPNHPPTLDRNSTPAQISYFRSIWQPGNHLPDMVPGHLYCCSIAGCRKRCEYKRDMARHYKTKHPEVLVDMNMDFPRRGRRVAGRRCGGFELLDDDGDVTLDDEEDEDEADEDEDEEEDTSEREYV